MSTDLKKEIGYAIAKGGIASVPVAGGILSELFGIAVTDPATKRREQVLQDIDQRLNQLEKEGLDTISLANNEEFLSVVLQAYNIAIRTHQADKKAALLNAISNTPKMTSIDDNIKHMFLMYIDEFNEWHLRILLLFNNPREFFGENLPSYYMGGLSMVLTDAYPELKERREFYDQAFKDLYSRGLLNTESLHGTMTGEGMLQPRTSSFGKQFIEFISED
jgi:hypothetical protein